MSTKEMEALAVGKDTLAYLEERIQRAVALVNRLRHEKDEALKNLAATRAALEDSQLVNMQLTDELNAFKDERHEVRNRIEKLLGHIDELGAA